MGVIFENKDDFEEVYLPNLRQKYNFDINMARDLYYNWLTLGRITGTDFFNKLGIPTSTNFIRGLIIDPEFPEFASKIKDKYKLSVLSNDAVEWSQILRKTYGLDEFVDNYFVSGSLGYRKPDKSAYIKVFDLLKAKPSDCTVVDNISQNLDSPQILGCKTIHFDRKSSNNVVKNFQELYERLMQIE